MPRPDQLIFDVHQHGIKSLPMPLRQLFQQSFSLQEEPYEQLETSNEEKKGHDNQETLPQLRFNTTLENIDKKNPHAASLNVKTISSEKKYVTKIFLDAERVEQYFDDVNYLKQNLAAKYIRELNITEMTKEKFNLVDLTNILKDSIEVKPGQLLAVTHHKQPGSLINLDTGKSRPFYLCPRPGYYQVLSNDDIKRQIISIDREGLIPITMTEETRTTISTTRAATPSEKTIGDLFIAVVGDGRIARVKTEDDKTVLLPAGAYLFMGRVFSYVIGDPRRSQGNDYPKALQIYDNQYYVQTPSGYSVVTDKRIVAIPNEGLLLDEDERLIAFLGTSPASLTVNEINGLILEGVELDCKIQGALFSFDPEKIRNFFNENYHVLKGEVQNLNNKTRDKRDAVNNRTNVVQPTIDIEIQPGVSIRSTVHPDARPEDLRRVEGVDPHNINMLVNKNSYELGEIVKDLVARTVQQTIWNKIIQLKTESKTTTNQAVSSSTYISVLDKVRSDLNGDSFRKELNTNLAPMGVVFRTLPVDVSLSADADQVFTELKKEENLMKIMTVRHKRELQEVENGDELSDNRLKNELKKAKNQLEIENTNPSEIESQRIRDITSIVATAFSNAKDLSSQHFLGSLMMKYAGLEQTDNPISNSTLGNSNLPFFTQPSRNNNRTNKNKTNEADTFMMKNNNT